MTDLNEYFDKLDELYKAPAKTVVDGYELSFCDSDISLRDKTVWEIIEIKKPDGNYANTGIYFEDNNVDLNDLDYDWEPDGEPTYVPYGDQSVLYDDGKGGLNGVNIAGFDFEEKLLDDDDNEIDREAACADIGCDDAELTKLIDAARKIATADLAEQVEKEILDNSDYWPDRDDEPDYDAYMDDERLGIN